MLLTCIHFKVGSLLLIKANVGKVELREMLKKLGNVEIFLVLMSLMTKEIGQEISHHPPWLPVLLERPRTGSSFRVHFCNIQFVIKVMSALEDYLHTNINCKFAISRPLR